MRLYYIAYKFSDGELQMIDGPYGTSLEAMSERDSMNTDKDEKLIVVRQSIDVTELD